MIPSISHLIGADQHASNSRKRQVMEAYDCGGDSDTFVCKDLLSAGILQAVDKEIGTMYASVETHDANLADYLIHEELVPDVQTTSPVDAVPTDLSSELDTPALEESDDDLLLYGDINTHAGPDVLADDQSESYGSPPDETNDEPRSLPPTGENHFEHRPPRRYKVIKRLLLSSCVLSFDLITLRRIHAHSYLLDSTSLVMSVYLSTVPSYDCK
jgi:hypothetical protein